MNDQPYNKRELDDKFLNVCTLIGEAKKDLHEPLVRIEVQTMKTNGRVNALENWRQWLTGGMAVLSLFIVPFLGWVAYKVSTIDTTVEKAVANALLPYSK